jgi:prephenate dehydrogenase
MRYVVVGAGAIGGLLAAALARAGVDVVVMMRPQRLADYEGHVAKSGAGTSRAAGQETDIAVLALCATGETQLRRLDALNRARSAASATAASAAAMTQTCRPSRPPGPPRASRSGAGWLTD